MDIVDVRTGYVTVGGMSNQVWSVPGQAYVPLADAGYQAWLARGNRSITVASEAVLWDLIAAQAPERLPQGNTTLRDRVRALAQALLDKTDSETGALLRAILLVLLDQLNATSKFEADLKAAVAANSTYANLRTAVAGIGLPPQNITGAQARTAIKQKVTDGVADV